MSVAVSGSLLDWSNELAALKERIGPVFGRSEVRTTAGAFIDGLLSMDEQPVWHRFGLTQGKGRWAPGFIRSTG